MNPGDKSLAAAFEERTIPEPNSGCLLWLGSLRDNGYGRLKHQGEEILAHRLAWFLAHGEMPGEFLVCHRCDTRGCVEWRHLFLGTPQDNYDDARMKGRNTRGVKIWTCKITEDDVSEIRAAYALGMSQREIGERFGLAQTQVSNIVLGKSWRHVREGV